MTPSDLELRCAFCGKTRAEVHRLVSAETEGLAICQECVGAALIVLATAGWVPPTIRISFGRDPG